MEADETLNLSFVPLMVTALNDTFFGSSGLVNRTPLLGAEELSFKAKFENHSKFILGDGAINFAAAIADPHLRALIPTKSEA